MPRRKKCRHRADGEKYLLTFLFIGRFGEGDLNPANATNNKWRDLGTSGGFRCMLLQCRERCCGIIGTPRKENFNGETWGQSGICLYFHRCSTDSIVCEALPRGNRTLRVCGHEYQPALLAGGASGVFGRGQSARSKR